MATKSRTPRWSKARLVKESVELSEMLIRELDRAAKRKRK
jgi:hypothetical protein